MDQEPGKFNGVPIEELSGRAKFEFEKLLEMEEMLKQGQSVCSVFTESMFRRQGLPLLSGMLDGTFNEDTWTDYVGSAFVPLQIVSDSDNSKLLFTIPPLLNTGRSLQHVDGQPSLTEETEMIRQQADIISEVGERQMYQMIDYTLDGIEQLSYEENALRAKQVIDLLNWIFRRYNVSGQLPYPEGLEELCNRIQGRKKPATAAQPEQSSPAKGRRIIDEEDY